MHTALAEQSRNLKSAVTSTPEAESIRVHSRGTARGNRNRCLACCHSVASRTGCQRVGSNDALQEQPQAVGVGSDQSESVHGHFPTGGWNVQWVGDSKAGVGESQPGGWAYNLLPFMEQQPLHGLANGNTYTPSGSLEQRKAGQMLVNILEGLICPSRREARLYPFQSHGSGQLPLNVTIDQSVVTANKTDYAANAGGDRRTKNDALECSPLRSKDKCAGMMTGVVFQKSAMPAGKLTDGTSKVFLIAEKFIPPSEYTTGHYVSDDNSALIGHHRDVIRFATLNYPPTQDTDSDASSLTYSFGGPHPAGWQVVFCDGHVKAVAFDGIDRNVFHSLGNRSDGTLVLED